MAHKRTFTRYLIPALVLILVAGAAVLLLRPNLLGGATTAGALVQVGRVRAADYHSLIFSPSDGSTLFFGHHNGLMQSTDGGRSWQVAVSRPNFDAMILGANPAAPDVVWTAGHEVLYRSTDGGKTWNEVVTDLPGLDIHAFAVGADPNTLYAFAVGFGLFKSIDGGTSWRRLEGAPRQPYALTVGGSTESLYIGTEQGLMISRDGGASFSAPIAVGGAPITALAAVPNADVVYAGSRAGLHRSDDGGKSWSKTSYSGAVAAVAVAPSNPGRVVVVDGQGNVFSTSAG